MGSLMDFYLPVVPITRLLAPALLATASVLLFRRAKGWPTVLMLVGSVTLLLVTTREFATGLSIERGWVQPGTFWFPTDSENQVVTIPFIVIQNLVFCFS